MDGKRVASILQCAFGGYSTPSFEPCSRSNCLLAGNVIQSQIITENSCTSDAGMLSGVKKSFLTTC